MGWTNVEASGIITTKAVLLRGVCIASSTSGHGVTVYEGQDATTGRKVMHVKTLANRSYCVHFNTPLECDRGIYVALDADCDEVLIHWVPQ